MLKITTLLIFFFVSTALLANDTKDSKPFLETTSISAESVKIVLENSDMNFKTELKKSEQVASELPAAILRLYQLEKVNFTGVTIYAHKPLELANIKNPIKAV
ncbi:hypothetical protein ACFSYG_06485 [Leeuwenhoekiella polynyae]|uniref:Uncharacterized protein n=1 Tax=Leeuwenhoekiella polynyae TaxID=1550906 RepID=A0A4Q0P6B9_9FLAO|nr:hypothetical protein [Leeuwenhoekiella polynyae]RXG21758.1 hypothetical protein DSM02_2004 [Leeuwenhoekiella polynyae]